MSDQSMSNMLDSLYRARCPEVEILSDYYLGHLSRDEASDVEKHLETCVLCTRDLEGLGYFMETQGRPLLMDIIDKIKASLKDISWTVVLPSEVPAPILGRLVRYKAQDGTQVSLNLVKSQSADELKLVGEILDKDRQPYIWKQVQLDLIYASGEWQSELRINFEGKFEIVLLNPDLQEVLISVDSSKQGLQLVNVFLDDILE